MEELVFKAKNGDKEAYTQLIINIKAELYRIAKSRISDDEDINDIIQNTILIGYLKINQLKYDRFFKTWIIRILINQCNKFFRKNKRQIDLDNKYIENIFPCEISNKEDSDLNFESIISNLDEVEKKIFKLYYEDKYTIKEISEILNINKNTIKSKLNRGREKIKKSYAKSLLLLFIVFMITTGAVFGSSIINWLIKIFDLSDSGTNNQGVLYAIENKDWIQNIEMNYIHFSENYQIKISYFLLDDINMYLLFELRSEDELNQFDRMTISDLLITDNNNNILYSDNPQFDQSLTKISGWKNIETNSNYIISELLYMTSTGYPNIEMLNISLSEIILYNDKEPSKYSNIIKSDKINIDLEVIDKFIDRNVIEFSVQEVNGNYNIKKAIITDTGFYSIIESNKGNAKFELDCGTSNFTCNCRLLDLDYANQKYTLLVYTNIDNENISKSIKLKNKKNTIILTQK